MGNTPFISKSLEQWSSSVAVLLLRGHLEIDGGFVVYWFDVTSNPIVYDLYEVVLIHFFLQRQKKLFLGVKLF